MTLINNNQAFPGNNISLSTNLINIAMGEKVLVDAGILNTILIGGWNRLLAGSNNIIQLGTQMTTTLGNTLNVILGNSSNYTNSKQTSHDFESQFAVNQILLNAGINNPQFITYQNKTLFIIATILTMYALTLGISLANTIYPPFKRQSDTELNTYGSYLILLDGISISVIILTQYYLAKIMANNTESAAEISLAAKGFSASLFYQPDQKPQLVLEQESNNAQQFDYYTNGTSGYSILGLLPGMPNNRFKNWRNSEYGVYNHDQIPSITLQKRNYLEDDNSILKSATIDIESSSLIMTAEAINPRVSDTQPNSENSHKWHSSLYLDAKVQLAGFVFSANNNNNGVIAVDKNKTTISRNFGKFIAITTLGITPLSSPIMPLKPEETSNALDISQSDSDDDHQMIVNKWSFEYPEIPTTNDYSILGEEQLTGLYLLSNYACLMTANFHNGIFIDGRENLSLDLPQSSNTKSAENYIIIKSNNENIARFSDGETRMGNTKLSLEGIQISDNFFIKNEGNLLSSSSDNVNHIHNNSNHEISFGGLFGLLRKPSESKDLKEITGLALQRIEQSAQHINAIMGYASTPTNSDPEPDETSYIESSDDDECNYF